jgi:hypothetical protein
MDRPFLLLTPHYCLYAPSDQRIGKGQDPQVIKFLKSFVAVLVIGGLTAAAIHFTMGGEQRKRERRGGGRPDGPVPVVTQ